MKTAVDLLQTQNSQNLKALDGELSFDRIVFLYILGTFGIFLEVTGGFWDVSWHTLGLVEDFFTLPHIILYSGITVLLLVGIIGVYLSRTIYMDTAKTSLQLLKGFNIALSGSVLQIIGGILDFWWHDNFGFDPFLFTPSHSILISGIVINGFVLYYGVYQLFKHYQLNQLTLERFKDKPNLFQILMIFALSIFWLHLNSIVYLVTDLDGFVYTFNLNSTDFNQYSIPFIFLAILLLTAVGAIIIILSKKIFNTPGPLSLMVLLVVLISITTNLGFRGLMNLGNSFGNEFFLFIPFYALFSVPIILFDNALYYKDDQDKVVLGFIFISPFIAFLDGWQSFQLWTDFPSLIPNLILTIILVVFVLVQIDIVYTEKHKKEEYKSVSTSFQ